MLNNISKKKKIIVIVLLAFIVIDLTILIIGSLPFTRAFYDSSATTNIDLDVAQFSFLVNGQSVPNDVTIDLQETLNSGYTKVVPGSSGIINLDLDASKSDVKIKCTITIDRANSTNLPTNLKLYSDENYTQEITDTEILDINYKTKIDKKIYWKWDFTENDENQYMNQNIKINMSVTGEQILEENVTP